MKAVRLKVPVTADDIESLEIGSIVYLDGVIYTGREGVYRRVIEEGAALPLELSELSNVNFHCSPAAAIEADGSYHVGGVTATASFRFAKWMQRWFELSKSKIIPGQCVMSAQDYKGLFIPAGAVVLTAVGYGSGARRGRGIKRVVDVF